MRARKKRISTKAGVLIISQTCSAEYYKVIENNNTTILPSQQKLFLSLAEGLSEITNTFCLSNRPIFPGNNGRVIWRKKIETKGKLSFYYPGFINIPILRHITFLSTLLVWIMVNTKEIRKEYKYVIMDPLLPFFTIPSKWILSKMGLVCVALVTDLPAHVTNIHSGKRISIFRKIYDDLGEKSLTQYDVYILLTSKMNQVVNPHMKPAIVMEGILDNEIYRQTVSRENILSVQMGNRIVLYAGGINKKFGIFTLLEAFTQINLDNWELHLYGLGKGVSQLEEVIKENPKVKFMGRISSTEVFGVECAANILINPRPTKEDYTEYSFPSKTLEYLASGVFTISTRLPGIPAEYFPYLSVIEDDSVSGVKEVLEAAMRLTDEERTRFGDRARRFVTTNKNQKVQARHIWHFLEDRHADTDA